MKPPAFQLYADDLISGTLKFSDAELGLYMRLLCAQWNEGSLPDDDDELLSYGRGRTPLGRVKSKFEKSIDGRLRNVRMEKVRDEQEAFRKAMAERGRAGADARWHKQCTSNAQAMPKQCLGNAKPMLADGSPVSSLHTPSIKTTKLPASAKAGDKFTEAQTGLTARYHAALAGGWENDRQKWMGRIKHDQAKTERVISEVESAIKDARIKTTPAQYAEQQWREFK